MNSSIHFSILMSIVYKSLAETSCGISILTVNYVKQCPTDAISWKMAAKRMNCESIHHNCLPTRRLNNKPSEFQFHCLINPWINATLEVCAFNRTIIGHCAEFNIGGAIVQDNYDADCTKHDPPCPSSYNSAEAYKYKTCYKLVAQHRKRTQNVLKSSCKRWFGHLEVIVLSIFLTLNPGTAFYN